PPQVTNSPWTEESSIAGSVSLWSNAAIRLNQFHPWFLLGPTIPSPPNYKFSILNSQFSIPTRAAPPRLFISPSPPPTKRRPVPCRCAQRRSVQRRRGGPRPFFARRNHWWARSNES